MAKYRNLFIDLDDTVYDFSAASCESFHETYELLHYERYFDSFEQYMSIYTPYNLELWRIYGQGKITKEELNKRSQRPTTCRHLLPRGTWAYTHKRAPCSRRH